MARRSRQLNSVATFEFTTPQRSLIEAAGSVYVEACPGAGKTQAIVQRFVDRPSVNDPRRGVALLSFTNAAVDEARSRCASAPHLLQVPNFVGTIDAFINRFIVGPVYTARSGRAPSFRDTWASVPTTRVSVKGVPGVFLLDWFDMTLRGVATLVAQRVPPDRRSAAQSLRPDQLAKVTDAVGARWRSLYDRGVLDAATSRMLMGAYLQDSTTRVQLRELFAARFAEVIVDEVQDCTEGDVLLLELIEEAGSTLVCVGDPDQAIYGFRGSGAGTLNGLLSRLRAGERLDGNFRSSPAICAAVGSLRHGSGADVAVGEAAGVTQPLTVATYRRPSDVRPAVMTILEASGIPESDAIVLAHAAATSRGCAGAGAAMRSTDSRLVLFAISVHRLQAAGGSPTVRRDALRDIERIVCELSGAEGTIDEYLDARGLTERWFRDCCLRIATALDSPFAVAPSHFKATLSELFATHEALGAKVSMLRTPNGDEWPVRPGQADHALRHTTIHGYKGLQHRAVVLVLPKAQAGSQGDGIVQWVGDQPGESRRVLYVGASRAEELLILATHESRKDEVVDKLTLDGVPHVVHA